MKEIKAYIRLKKAEEVIEALEDAGVPGLTAIEVKAIGGAAIPEREEPSTDYIGMNTPITKLEVVCSDSDMERLVKIITDVAYSGHRGDGMIFVSNIWKAVKIRTREHGEKALVASRET